MKVVLCFLLLVAMATSAFVPRSIDLEPEESEEVRSVLSTRQDGPRDPSYYCCVACGQFGTLCNCCGKK
ncbi:hypothetical protein BaRGS_00016014 [Batillaria attramentaria]|uniref:Hepcidin n=1 Tax=Batillaria attramentaria TaxID=370345 RepID=A0ABD0KZV9_9CAEN